MKLVNREALLILGNKMQRVTLRQVWHARNFVYFDPATGDPVGRLIFDETYSFHPILFDPQGWLFSGGNALQMHLLLPQLEGAILREEFLRMTNNTEDLLP